MKFDTYLTKTKVSNEKLIASHSQAIFNSNIQKKKKTAKVWNQCKGNKKMSKIPFWLGSCNLSKRQQTILKKRKKSLSIKCNVRNKRITTILASKENRILTLG